MCELFALSASAPVDIKLSLSVLARHGGAEGIHGDGWGVAYFEGRDAHVLREASAAARSPWVEFLQGHPLRRKTALAHIRHATSGAIELANTQPFARELHGRMIVFAHNGTLAGVEPIAGHRYQPIGDADSELAFCALLEMLAGIEAQAGPRREETEFRIFAEFASQMRRHGPANIIVATKDFMFAHADRRTQRPSVIAPPGLWLLERHCHPGTYAELADAGVALASPRGQALLCQPLLPVPALLPSDLCQPQRGHV
jgi:glutamine amidotransferase